MTLPPEGSVVRLRKHKSKALPAGSIGVVLQNEVIPSLGNAVRIWVEWRRIPDDMRSVELHDIKPIPLEQLTKRQKLWLVKRRLKKALEHE